MRGGAEFRACRVEIPGILLAMAGQLGRSAPDVGVSLPTTALYALAFLTLGISVTEGSTGWFLGGVALLVFAAASWRYLRRRGD